MQKTIELLGQTVAYTFRTNKRTRGVRLSVHGDGSFFVSASPRISEHRVLQFVHEKAAWILSAIERVKRGPQKIKLGVGDRKEFARYKTAAHQLATMRLRYFNEHYGFIYNNVSIRNQKTRWGSCSKKGNLSFTYKIVFLEPDQLDYIIVHELCHLSAFNHSKKFWDLVARALPHHRSIRKTLRTISLS